MKLLVLGGTREASALVEQLGGQAILSLAGTTKRPLVGPHRVGGFGGVDGLANYLKTENITALIDATHPFAAQISANAAQAAALVKVPLLRLNRPAWKDEARWIEAPNLPAAAALLPAKARVFLSVGSRSVEPFLGRDDIWFLTRSIEPAAHLPANGEQILQRPPFTLAAETALLKAHKITHLVSKNAGGSATRAKLDAAHSLHIQVIIVKRPQLPSVLEVETIPDALNWVQQIKGIK